MAFTIPQDNDSYPIQAPDGTWLTNKSQAQAWAAKSGGSKTGVSPIDSAGNASFTHNGVTYTTNEPGVTDFASMRKAANTNTGGITVTANGRSMLFFPESLRGNPGMAGIVGDAPGGGIFVDAEQFRAAHPDSKQGFLGIRGLPMWAPVAGVLGGAGLSGALSGAAAGGLSAETLASIPGYEGALASEFAPLAGAATGAGGTLGVNALNAAVNAAATEGGGGLLSTLGSLIPAIPSNVLGGAIQGIGGLLASDAQGDAYKDVSQQFMNIGAPYRNRLDASYQPGFNLWNQPGYAGAFDQAASDATRQWSIQGNPANNPGIQGSILSSVMNQSYLPALSNYRGGLMQAGGLGLNTSGTASLAGAGSEGSGWEAIGAGLGTALNPQPSIADLFKQWGTGGNNQQPRLNIGGLPWGGSNG